MAAHALLVLTTLMVSVRTVPVLVSRISLRKRSVIDGQGPMVSFGVTAQAAFVERGGGVDEGVVDESLHPSANAAPAAPMTVKASRRSTFWNAFPHSPAPTPPVPV